MKYHKPEKRKYNQQLRNTEAITVQHSEPAFDGSLYSKFTAFMNKQRIKYLQAKLDEFYGKNFTINYNPNYAFTEEWQNYSSTNTYTQSESIWKVNSLGIFLSLAIMALYTLFIWLRSVQFFFFEEGEHNSWKIIYLVTIGFQIPDSYLRLIISQKFNHNSKMSLIRVLKIIYPNLYCIVYIILIALEMDQYRDPLWLIMEMFCYWLLFSRAKAIYQSFRLSNFALSYEYHLKSIDLVINLSFISHLIAIILYTVTLFETGDTWFGALNLQSPNGVIRYIYSFYFGTTTIFTVGYGDISPKNPIQIFILIIVQSCGIIIIAYLMSEIGHNLSTIRKGRETLEKELTLINKMKKYYRINDELVYRARSYLIGEKPNSDHLAPDEEKQVLNKFNQQLRQQIKQSSSLSIVKSCIFFLCRWSKVMQNSVAAKLQNILFTPGELIYQPEGKERIYIIKMGKIDIYSQKKGKKRRNQRILKTITTSLDKEVSDNAYGYTAVISRRPVHLYAIASEYTSAYYIERKRFLECIQERDVDFEYFHEIKSKIDDSAMWEGLEVPALMNSKHHFNPTRTYILRKYQAQKQVGRNKRRQYRRNHRKMSHLRTPTSDKLNTIVISFHNEKQTPLLEDSQMLEATFENAETTEPCKRLIQLSQTDFRRLLTEPQSTLQSLRYELLAGSRANKKAIDRTYNLREQESQGIDPVNRLKTSLERAINYQRLKFQHLKEYPNYFPSSNLTNLLRRLEVNQFILGSKQIQQYYTMSQSNFPHTSFIQVSNRLAKV